MKKNITIKDVAKETGVHVSTVSRALSPNARASLSSEVVERIKNKAAQMGYRPNLVASGLRTNRTMTVGIVIPDITNSLFPPIVRGVESVLEEAGYALEGAPSTSSISHFEMNVLDLYGCQFLLLHHMNHLPNYEISQIVNL